MKITRKEFRNKLTKEGKVIFDFTLKYGLPSNYFSDLLGVCQMTYNTKLKGGPRQIFNNEELEIIDAEMQRLEDVFKDVKSDIIDIYGKVR